jgi:hypothetical protein
MNVAAAEELSQTSLDEIVIRWKLAGLYMSALHVDDNFPPGQAIRLLIDQDFATLLRELHRLRPDLG